MPKQNIYRILIESWRGRDYATRAYHLMNNEFGCYSDRNTCYLSTRENEHRFFKDLQFFLEDHDGLQQLTITISLAKINRYRYACNWYRLCKWFVWSKMINQKNKLAMR